MAPTTVPTPPVTAAPPMNAAAIASSSNMLPALGWAPLDRDEKTTPATAARKPMLTKIQKLTARTLTPDSVAAARLPPIAYTWHPKTVRVVMTLYAMISTARMMSTIGRPRACASCHAKYMTTAPTSTILATNSGKDSTGCSYLMRAIRLRYWLTAYPATAIPPMSRVNAS